MSPAGVADAFRCCMIEPQQGLSYGDQVAIAKRAEANGFETLFRSDHYAELPGPGRSARRPTPGRSSPGWPATRNGSGWAPRVAGDVPSSGQLREGRDDGRRDERRPAGGRRRRRLERRSSTASSACRSRRSRNARTCWRTSWRSCTACGASRTAGRTQGHSVSDRRRELPPEAGRRPGPAADGDRRLPGRGSSWAARVRHARYRLAARYADEFNLSSSGPDKAPRGVRGARRGLPGDRPRPGDAGPLGDGRRRSIGRTRRR